jgi:hypothetical protein
MSDKAMLTIAETAELLNCSAGFVRKKITLSESNLEGGWPKTIYVNLQPNGAKSLFRINKGALEDYLQTNENSSTIEEQTEVACAFRSV